MTTATTVKPLTKKHYLVMLFLFVLSLALYSGTLKHEFVNYDDPALAYENKQVKTLNVKEIFSSIVAEDYIPLTVTSYAIDHALFGMNPMYFHLHNVLLHALNGVLVFLLIWWLSQNLVLAGFTAFLFAVHPLHVESVAWVAERKDVLSGFYSLLTLIFYVRFLQSKRSWVYALSILCFALALFAKFMAVSIPAILILMELQKRVPLKKSLLRLFPFVALSGVFTYIHLSLHNSPSGERAVSLLRGVDSLAFYLSKVFYPVNLSAFYEQGVTLVAWWEYILATVLVLVFAGAVLRYKKHKSSLVFGAVFFAATILPVLQIVPFGNLFAFADRFMYLPSVGLFFAIGVIGLAYLENHSRIQKRLLTGMWVIVGILLTALSFQRVEVWKNSKSLWSDALSVSPYSAVAHNNLGLTFLSEANREPAISEFIQASQLRNDYTDPYVNLGLAYLDLKQLSESETALKEALRINPKLPAAHVNMALVLEAQNHLEQAGEHYLRALELDPDLSTARYNMGVIYYKLHQQDKALATLRETVEKDPFLSEAHHGIGVILLERGDLNAAVPEFQRASELDKLYEAPRIQLINIYNKQGKTDLMAQEVQELQRIRQELQAQPPSRPRR